MKQVILTLAFYCLPAAAHAATFSYRDDKGTLHAVSSQDDIPERYRGHEKTLTQKSSVNPGEVNLKLERVGNSLLIPVSFGDGVEVLMVLDTGASTSMISTSIAEKLKPAQVGTTKMTTASDTIEVPIVNLSSVAVKQCAVENLKVMVNNLPKGNGLEQAEGLLGVDFLHHFRMQLDTESGQLHLEKK